MESLEKLIEELGSHDQAAAYRARRSLTDLTNRAKGAERTRLAADLARALVAVRKIETDESRERRKRKQRGEPQTEPKYSARARVELLRYLASVAGDAEIPALKKAAEDLELREMARWALDRMTCHGATELLIALAKNGLGPEFRIGALNSLGRRQGPGVAEALKECVGDDDDRIALTAVEALANFPDPSADAVIVGVLKRAAAGRRQNRLNRARVRLAETLTRHGQKEAGKKVYQAILASAAAPAQQRAAKLGLEKLGMATALK